MKWNKTKQYAVAEECPSFAALYAARDEIADAPILFVDANKMQDDADAAIRAFLCSAPFLTVIAAEDLGAFSYETLAAFDVRLSAAGYPAEKVTADERYRLLCGEAAFDKLQFGGCETAPNFVTVLADENGFAAGAAQYLQTLCNGKSAEQLHILAGCIRAAGIGREAVERAESEGFYALMKQKTEGSGNV